MIDLKKLAEEISNSKDWWDNHDDPNYETLARMISKALQKVRDETILECADEIVGFPTASMLVRGLKDKS